MKTIYNFVNEAKTKVTNFEFVSNSPEFYNRREAYLNILAGKPVLLYHGTNRDFKKFDIKKARTPRNNKFWGDGIFFTVLDKIAFKYAYASANYSLDYELIERAKKVNKELYKFMDDLYKNGNVAWQNIRDTKIHEKGEIKGVDLNEISDIVHLMPDAKVFEPDDNDFSLFGSTSSIHQYDIDNIKKLGLGDYRYKNIHTELITKGATVFITKSQAQARKSKADIIIVHSHNDLVDGYPEIIVRDPKRLKIKKIEYYDND